MNRAAITKRLADLERDGASKSFFDLSCVPFNKELAGQSAMVQLCDWLSKPEQNHLYGVASEVKL